jgi:protein TonB
MKHKTIGCLILSIFLGFVAGRAGAAEVPLDIEDGAGLAAAILHPAPVYTKMAAQLKLEGKVGIAAYVNEAGAVYDTIISYGNPILVQMAVSAVKEWKFKPFVNEHGKPAKAMVRLTFDLKPPARPK